MTIIQGTDMRSALFILIGYNTVYTATCEDNETGTPNTHGLLEAAVTTRPSLEDADHDQAITIKAQDAMKTLEATNNTFILKREALIKQNKPLMEEYNVTELNIESNQSGTVNISSGVCGNSINILRNQQLTGCEQMKHFIKSHWSFTTRIPADKMKDEADQQLVKDGYKFIDEILTKYNIDLDKSI